MGCISQLVTVCLILKPAYPSGFGISFSANYTSIGIHIGSLSLRPSFERTSQVPLSSILPSLSPFVLKFKRYLRSQVSSNQRFLAHSLDFHCTRYSTCWGRFLRYGPAFSIRYLKLCTSPSQCFDLAFKPYTNEASPVLQRHDTFVPNCTLVSQREIYHSIDMYVSRNILVKHNQMTLLCYRPCRATEYLPWFRYRCNLVGHQSYLFSLRLSPVISLCMRCTSPYTESYCKDNIARNTHPPGTMYVFLTNNRWSRNAVLTHTSTCQFLVRALDWLA